jgi:serine/threonine protein kinase
MEMPKIGTEFGGYRIQGLIGRGGMSVVYQAEHPRLSRTVALKIIAPELAEDDVFRERFVRESRVAASLDHANIIPIYDTGDQDGLLYIVMRYVKTDLKALIRQEGELSPGRTLAIAGQVASALDAAHKLDLVHRDVKPANVLIATRAGTEGEDHAYLTDFGLTKHLASRSGLTGSGQFVGTVDYMSPEQIEGKQADGRADVYALGCVVFQCLTGQVPFEREADAAVIWAHLREPPPRITDHRRNLPAGIDDIVARAMAKSPEDRFPTCREFVLAARRELDARSDQSPIPGSRETVLRSGPSAPSAPSAPLPPPESGVSRTFGEEAPVSAVSRSHSAHGSPNREGEYEGATPSRASFQRPTYEHPPEEAFSFSPPAPAAEVAAPPAATAPARRISPVLMAAAAAALVVVAVGAYWLTRGGETTTPTGGATTAGGAHGGGHGPGGTFPDEVERQFTLFHVPDTIKPFCHRIPEGERVLFNRDAFRALGCSPDLPIREIRYYLMHDGFALRQFSKQQRANFAPQAGAENCGIDQRAPVRWGTNATDGSHAIVSSVKRYNGQVICYRRPDGVWVMEWSDGPTKIYTVAASEEQTPQALLQLWREGLGPAHPEHEDEVYECSGAPHDLAGPGQLTGSVLEVNEAEGCVLFTDGEHLYEIQINESTESKFATREELMAHVADHAGQGTRTLLGVETGPENEVVATSFADA